MLHHLGQVALAADGVPLPRALQGFILVPGPVDLLKGSGRNRPFLEPGDNQRKTIHVENGFRKHGLRLLHG